eukprot:7329772-Heterocapsa_arctica.AAC.1
MAREGERRGISWLLILSQGCGCASMMLCGPNAITNIIIIIITTTTTTTTRERRSDLSVV